MENANKALLMAAGVLIAVMLISLGVYIINQAGSFAKRQEDVRLQLEVAKFNSDFEPYYQKDSSESEITVYDLVTIFNLITQNNKKYSITDENYIKINIYLSGQSNPIKTQKNNTDSENNKFINEYSIKSVGTTKEYRKFECTALIYNTYGKVEYMKFDEI